MKKFLALLLAAIMVFSLAACQGKPADDTTTKEGEKQTEAPGPVEVKEYEVTIWVADEIKDLTIKQIEDYNANNEDGLKFKATVEAVSEADAGTNMITDVEAGADLFCFAQDQFARLVLAGAVSQLGAKATEKVTAENAEGVVKAAKTSDGSLYAYPLTADNGYFMYYDKSVIPEADVDSFEKLLADCEKAQKYFSFEAETSAWYIASWFFATGCVSEWTIDETGKFLSVNDDFNSDKGLISAKGLYKFVSSDWHLSSSSGAGFEQNCAVVVTGIWDYETVKGILGDNMGVTDLPSFEVDGKEYHLGSFNGCKLMGVKPTTDQPKLAACHKLAQYLTGEKCQLERFNERSWGPSNLNAQASPEVQANPGLAALLKQAPYSLPQGQIHGSWWDIAKVIGTDVMDSDGSDAGLKAALEAYQAKIDGLFTMDEATAKAFTVIGSINDTGWGTDFKMTEVSDGVWVSDDVFDMPAGTEFKCRQGLSWTVAYPADNFVVETAGKYKVQLTVSGETGTVELIAP